MPDALWSALQTEGLIWLFAAIVAAGLVRGFSGFGSAMIIMPAASSVLTPFGAITFLIIVELVGPLPNLPDALREGHRGDALRLIIGAAVTLPLGLWGLSLMAPEIFGWAVSGIVLVLLCLLMLGVRYRGYLHPPLVFGAGGLGGFLAGVSGLPGPPVIMLYMASTQAIAVIRANFLLYLLAIDVLMLTGFAVLGQLRAEPVVIGFLLIVPYVMANMAGARLFDPGQEGRFRAVAYTIIAASALLGLPIWSGSHAP